MSREPLDDHRGPPQDSLVRVYTAEHEMEAGLVQATLEEHGLHAIVQGQNLKMIHGSVPVTEQTYPSIWVRAGDAAAAMEIIEEHRNRPRAERPRLWVCSGCGEGIEEQFTHCWNCGGERGELVNAQSAIPVSENVLDYRNPSTPAAPRGAGEVEPEPVNMPKWELKGIMPEMPVSDVAAAVAFYCNTLDFQQQFFHPPAYAIVQRDHVQIALLGTWSGATPGTGRCYAFVQNIDSYYADIESAQVNIVEPLAAREYGMKDFAITDPDGNRLAFGEEV